MKRHNKSRRFAASLMNRLRVRAFAISLAILAISLPSVGSADPILNFVIEDKQILPDDTLVTIGAYMNSRQDSVAGFEILLNMSNHYVLRFREIEPATAEGSVIHDWDMFTCSDMGNPDGYIVSIVALYSLSGPQPDGPHPIPPGDQPQLIFTINAAIVPDEPDTLCGYTGTVRIEDYFTRFAAQNVTPEYPWDDLIGYVLTIEYDSTFENCVEWIGDSCISWADTVVDVDSTYGPDWDLLNYMDGQYVFIPYIAGDADGSGAPDIDDVVFLINFIFASGQAPDPMEPADADCSGGVDIDDVVHLIEFIFAGGPEPCSECP